MLLGIPARFKTEFIKEDSRKSPKNFEIYLYGLTVDDWMAISDQILATDG